VALAGGVPVIAGTDDAVASGGIETRVAAGTPPQAARAGATSMTSANSAIREARTARDPWPIGSRGVEDGFT
jgi:hypothetical protein